MTPRMRSQAMTLLALTLPLMACAQAPAPAAPAAPAPAAAPRAPAPQLVSGLPDFTNLVEQVGPAWSRGNHHRAQQPPGPRHGPGRRR